MPKQKSFLYPTSLYFPSKVLQQVLLLYSLSWGWWWSLLLLQYGAPLPQFVPAVVVVVVVVVNVPVVSGFHVTSRTHHGDDIFGYMNDVNYATYTSTGKQSDQQLVQPQLPSFLVDNDNDCNKLNTVSTTTTSTAANIKLVTLSTKPMLFVSSGSPVLTQVECQQLSSYFLMKADLENNQHDVTNHIHHPGQQVLEKLQTLLDGLILRPENTMVEPRFLCYETPTVKDRSDMMERTMNHNPILPDGLHVDTNNGKYFRYCTVLVYLTSSKAATVFPLANIHNHHYRHHQIDMYDGMILYDNHDVITHPQHQELQHAAEYLIQNHIQHTRQTVGTATSSSSSSLPNATEELETMALCRDRMIDIQQKQNLIEHAVSGVSGVRIVPQMGHIAVFFNIDPQTGYADPYSFHGSEESYDEKQLLTFFYELLPSTEQDTVLFHTPMEFGQQIQKRIRRMQEAYPSWGNGTTPYIEPA